MYVLFNRSVPLSLSDLNHSQIFSKFTSHKCTTIIHLVRLDVARRQRAGKPRSRANPLIKSMQDTFQHQVSVSTKHFKAQLQTKLRSIQPSIVTYCSTYFDLLKSLNCAQFKYQTVTIVGKPDQSYLVPAQTDTHHLCYSTSLRNSKTSYEIPELMHTPNKMH